MAFKDSARAEPVIPISDRQRAIDFYQGKLGFPVVRDGPEGVYFQAGDRTRLSIYESVGAGQSRATLAAFVVDDLDAAMNELRGNGVVFEEYDMPELKTEAGVASFGDMRGAWFKDPDGNIIAVVETPPGV